MRRVYSIEKEINEAKKPLFIAHRGDVNKYPENSLEAFHSAFLNGADGVEMDIQLYGGEIVVSHHLIKPGTSNLLKLSEILPEINGKGLLQIEIKAFSTEIIPSLSKVLEPFRTSDIELTSSDIPILPFIKKAFPHFDSGIIMNNFLLQDWMTKDQVFDKVLGWASMVNANIVNLPFSIIDTNGGSNLVRELQKCGLGVNTRILKNELQKVNLTQAIAWNVDRCMLDDLSILH